VENRPNLQQCPGEAAPYYGTEDITMTLDADVDEIATLCADLAATRFIEPITPR